MTHDGDTDPVATAAYLAVLADLFPAEHPGQVRTIGDDDIPTLAGVPCTPQLEHFTIFERLGRGSTGEVYRARDDRTGRIVAVKFMRAGTERDAVRLESEARLLVRCTHPNIVHVYQVATRTAASVVLVMEYIAGTTFDAWLSTPRRPRDILHLLIEVGRALEAAHNVGVIHRDIQPTNVMVDLHGRAKLIDFGLANEEKPANGPAPTIPTHVSPMVGTYEYIAPEHRDGQGCTSRSDQYSFCALLFKSLYGHPPHDLPIHALPTRPRLPSHVRAALLRGLRLDPQHRWPSMDQLLQELARPWWKRRRFALAILVPFAFLLSVVVVTGMQSWYSTEPLVEACTQRLMNGAAEARRQAERFGISADVDFLVPDPRQTCAESLATGKESKIDDLALCVEAQLEALSGLPALRLDDADAPSPRLRLPPGQQRAPLPPLPRCFVDSTLRESRNGFTRLRQVMQLRILVQHQQYVLAKRLLENTRLIDALTAIGAETARAEALLYAAQIARRFAQQSEDVTINGLEVDLLLGLAQTASHRGERDDLRHYVRLERFHLALDRKNIEAARTLLAEAESLQTTPELAIRTLQARARLRAVDDPLGAAEALQEAWKYISNDPRLRSTTIPLEIEGLRALYRSKVSPTSAHTVYEEVMRMAEQRLGQYDYLLATIAINASHNAFAADEPESAERWGSLGVRYLITPFGTRTLPLEQLTYSLGRGLLIAGRSATGIMYADQALGHARKLGVGQEISFALQLRSILELRNGRFDAALRSAKEALESLPANLSGDSRWRIYFEISAMTVEAEASKEPRLDHNLQALQKSIEENPSQAFPEALQEVRSLRAHVLTVQRRFQNAAEVLSDLETNQTEWNDPITYADFWMLRATIEESHNNMERARAFACQAKGLYEKRHCDGYRRLIPGPYPGKEYHRLTSTELFRDCPLPSADLLKSCG